METQQSSPFNELYALDMLKDEGSCTAKAPFDKVEKLFRSHWRQIQFFHLTREPTDFSLVEWPCCPRPSTFKRRKKEFRALLKMDGDRKTLRYFDFHVRDTHAQLDAFVRTDGLLANNTLPYAALQRLAPALFVNPNSFICMALAMNPSCPIDILVVMSLHPYWGVRENVTRNLKCPPCVLYRLLKDPDAEARCKAEDALANDRWYDKAI